jgi:hypothetical protein
MGENDPVRGWAGTVGEGIPAGKRGPSDEPSPEVAALDLRGWSRGGLVGYWAVAVGRRATSLGDAGSAGAIDPSSNTSPRSHA